MSQSEQDKYSKFNALLDRHKAQIENMCTRRSRGEYNLFAELRQECYISIWKHQDSLRADANIMQETLWVYWQCRSVFSSPDATGINCVELTFFEEDNVASLIVTTVNYTVDRYDASYTYIAGKGTLSLEHRETHATSTASFSVSGDNLTLVREGATYILPLFD